MKTKRKEKAKKEEKKRKEAKRKTLCLESANSLVNHVDSSIAEHK